MEQRFDRCAYHPTQRLVTFCSDKKCLLPLCQVCEKIHLSQHKMSQTVPQFQNLSSIFEDTNKNMKILQSQYSNLITQITKIQQNKRRESSQLKQIFKRKRLALIKQFQENLIELQELFLKNLAEEQKQFINKIQSIDQQICMIHEKLIEELIKLNKKDNPEEKFTSFKQKSQAKPFPYYTAQKKIAMKVHNLSSPSCVKVLIEYLSGNHQQFYKLNLLNIKQKIKQLQENKVQLISLQSEALQKIKQAMIEYFTVYKCSIQLPSSNSRIRLIQNY